jgi:Ca2+-binding EF-hand superfamily protein
MKHRLLHEFTREEIKLAFDQADVQKNGHLCVNELKNAISYLNLHLPNGRIVESIYIIFALILNVKSFNIFSY